MRTKGAVSLKSIKVKTFKPLVNTLPDEAYVTVGAQWFRSLMQPEYKVIQPNTVAAAICATAKQRKKSKK